MKDITERLEESVKWIVAHSRYEFDQDPNHNALRMSTDTVETMRDAIEAIQNLRKEIEEWQDIALV